MPLSTAKDAAEATPALLAAVIRPTCNPEPPLVALNVTTFGTAADEEYRW